METKTRPAVELTDSRLVEGSVVLAHRNHHTHKLTSAAVLTRAELQVFVQQAHDRYGITADPFATPGSADAEAWVDGDVIRHSGELYERRRGHWSTGIVNRRVLTDREADNTVRFYPNTTEVLRRGGVDQVIPAPHTAERCPDPCQHDAEGDPWPDSVGYGAPE